MRRPGKRHVPHSLSPSLRSAEYHSRCEIALTVFIEQRALPSRLGKNDKLCTWNITASIDRRNHFSRAKHVKMVAVQMNTLSFSGDTRPCTRSGRLRKLMGRVSESYQFASDFISDHFIDRTVLQMCCHFLTFDTLS